jgi:1-acyl-sn-glycerol-3-phosphate acyltransferase
VSGPARGTAPSRPDVNERPDARSVLIWIVSILHFVPATLGLIALRFLLGQHRVLPVLRLYCRVILRLAGMRLTVRVAPGVDPDRPCFLAANHVNVFDPFVICAAAPQNVRGLELESHFRIPVYGWLVRHFGNVPVPDRLSREGLDRLERRALESLANGISLVVYPEGTRTRTGNVGPFRPGVFRLAARAGVPIVPVAVRGAWQFQKVSSPRLRPGPVEVELFDPIGTEGADPDELRRRVHGIVRGGVEDHRAE